MTTLGLIKSCYKANNLDHLHKRLLGLEKAGYITRKFVGDEEIQGWILTKKGFKEIIEELPNLKAESYKPTHGFHDLYATAFHLGDWFRQTPKNAQLITERELRCLDKRNLPKEVPISQNHIPDGITIIDNGDKKVIVGFELELNSKLIYRYEPIAGYYGSQRFENVFWCVENPRLAQNIIDAARREIGDGFKIHNFILFNEFIKLSWDAKIVAGNMKNDTIRAALTRLSHGEDTVEPRHKNENWLLCTMKSPRTLRPYNDKRKTKTA